MSLELGRKLKRRRSWVPALLVFATVAAAGSRLVVLSVQQRAEGARTAAQGAAARCARAIEQQLDELATLAASTARGTALPPGSGSGRPFRVFEWASDGSLATSSPAEAAAAKAIVTE